MPISPPHVSGLTFNHLDVADRLQHVYGLADTFVATTAKLKGAEDKGILFIKVSQAPPRAA